MTNCEGKEEEKNPIVDNFLMLWPFWGGKEISRLYSFIDKIQKKNTYELISI